MNRGWRDVLWLRALAVLGDSSSVPRTHIGWLTENLIPSAGTQVALHTNIYTLKQNKSLILEARLQLSSNMLI